MSELELSVVIRLVGGARSLDRCLHHLVPQVDEREAEIIVPYDESIGQVRTLETRYPTVCFLDLGQLSTEARGEGPGVEHERYDRRSAAGLRAARGRIVAQLEDFGAPAEDWVEQLLAAHATLPHAVIGGVVEQVGRGLLNWAVYFLDFGRYHPTRSEGAANYVSDVNVSYRREALEAVAPVWKERYNEVVVHDALRARGETLWLRPQIRVRQDRGRLALAALLLERLYWGRLYAAVRARTMGLVPRLLYAVAGPLIPLVLLARVTRRVLRGGRDRLALLRAFPALVLLTELWGVGEFWGYLTGRAT